jgi:hypothetical protein
MISYFWFNYNINKRNLSGEHMSNIQIAHHYNKYNTTKMLDTDIKNIKKINNIYDKYYRTKKLSYLYELVNIIKTINNYINIQNGKDDILELVNEEYKHNVALLISNVDSLTIEFLRENKLVLG